MSGVSVRTLAVVDIYALTDPSGEPRYVGKASDPTSRRKEHMWEAKRGGGTHRLNWLRSLLSKGLEPGVVVLETVPVSLWQEKEISWIADLKARGFSLTNQAPGGLASMAMLGRHHTDETKQKMSLAGLGRPATEAVKRAVGAASHARRGLPRKPRPDLAERNRLRIWTDGARMKQASFHTGKTISSEHRARLREGHRKWREQRKDGDAL